MSNKITSPTKSAKELKKLSRSGGAVIDVEIATHGKRDKLITAKRLAGLSGDLAAAAADSQIERDKGRIVTAFPAGDLDRAEALATAGVNTNAAQVPTDTNNSPAMDAEVHLNNAKS